jgi:fluoroacetyl-CoA thioesterase
MAENTIKVGLEKKQRFLVEEQHSALHIGSGSMGVLSTPSMIGFMEITARQLLDEHLPETHTTVGVQVNVAHKAACPLGAEVEARVEVREVEGRRVRLAVEVWRGETQLGAGEHARAIVEKARFLDKVQNPNNQ